MHCERGPIFHAESHTRRTQTRPNEIVNSLDAAAERGLRVDAKEMLRYIGVDYDIELLSTTETHNKKSNVLPD